VEAAATAKEAGRGEEKEEEEAIPRRKKFVRGEPGGNPLVSVLAA
jgi:hypothetical protein